MCDAVAKLRYVGVDDGHRLWRCLWLIL